MGQDRERNVFETSWTNLEVSVAEAFRNAWWDTETTQHYLDPFTGIPREIDVIATKKHRVWGAHARMWFFDPVDFEMRVFIECKYLNNNVWLYIRNVKEEKLNVFFSKMWTYDELIQEYLRMNGDIPLEYKSHRYFSNKQIAYQSTDNGDKGFWMQWIKQVIHWLSSDELRSRTSWYKIEFPVLMVNTFNKVTVKDDESKIDAKLSQPILFEIDYINKHKQPEYFLVEIISFEEINEYIVLLEKEFSWLVEKIFQFESFKQRN